MENMKSLPNAQAWAHQSRHILHSFYQDIFPDTCCLLWSMLRKHTLRNKTRSGWCWCLRSALSDGRLFLGCCAGCCCSWAVTTAVLVFLVGTVDETSPYTFYKAEKITWRYVYQNHLDICLCYRWNISHLNGAYAWRPAHCTEENLCSVVGRLGFLAINPGLGMGQSVTLCSCGST